MALGTIPPSQVEGLLQFPTAMFLMAPLPDTGMLIVVAPADVHVTLPVYRLYAGGVNRTSILVTGTAPAAGVNEMEFVENALVPVRISNPAGGVTNKGVVRLAPCTVKLEEAEELPTLMTPNEPLKEEVVGMITGPLASIPFNTISSIRMVSVLVPVRVKRSFKPFICAGRRIFRI